MKKKNGKKTPYNFPESFWNQSLGLNLVLDLFEMLAFLLLVLFCDLFLTASRVRRGYRNEFVVLLLGGVLTFSRELH